MYCYSVKYVVFWEYKEGVIIIGLILFYKYLCSCCGLYIELVGVIYFYRIFSLVG